MTISKSEKFYVFQKGQEFLCRQPGGIGLFWSHQAEWAVRGRNAQKLKSCALQTAAKSHMDATDFLNGATLCRVEVGLKPVRTRQKHSVESRDVVLVASVLAEEIGFFGYSPDGKPTPLLAKAHGFVPEDRDTLVADAQKIGDKMCRYLTLTPIRQIVMPMQQVGIHAEVG